VVGRRDHLAQQVDGSGGSWPGQQVAVRIRERPLEIDPIELGGQGVQDGLSEFIEMSLVGQDGIQVRAVQSRGPCIRRGAWQEARLEVPLRARADDDGAEADRGDVPFTDATQAERHPSLARAQAALVWGQDCARIAHGRAFGRVFRSECRSQQQGARRRQLT
jgi:hypothetical protein